MTQNEFNSCCRMTLTLSSGELFCDIMKQLYGPKRQSSVTTVNMMKYIAGSSSIMHLDDYGCICTCYILALLKLTKGLSHMGSYHIIHGVRILHWKKWLLHTMQYGLIDSECMHSLCYFLDKNKESFYNIVKYHSSSHAKQFLSSVYKGELNHDMMK